MLENYNENVHEFSLYLREHKLTTAVIFLLSFLLLFRLFTTKKDDANTDNITKFIPNSKFIGNGFFINNTDILTTYDTIYGKCRTHNSQFPRIFVLFKGKIYKSTVVFYNNIYRLAIMRVDNPEFNKTKIKYLGTKTYLRIGNDSNLETQKNVYYYINNNKPFQPMIKTGVLYSVFDNVFTIMSKKRNLEHCEGMPVLDERLSVIGVLSSNDKNQNKLFALNNKAIRLFLRQYNVKFGLNTQGISKDEAKEYLNDTVVQFVCVDDEVRTLNNRSRVR